MTGKYRRKSGISFGFALLVRGIESLVIVGLVTGINVAQLLLDNPFVFLEALYGRVYIMGNIVWAAIVFVMLNITNLDGPLLTRLGLLDRDVEEV